MKKLNLITLLVLTFSFTMLNAQNDYDTHDNQKSESRFSFTTYGGIGYAIVDNKNQPNYNLDVNTIEFLLHYRIGKHYGIATGIGMNQLTGNGFYYVHESFYHERGIIKVPMLFSLNYNLSPKVRLVANIGLYGHYIFRDEYSFFNGGAVEDIYKGWNLGWQSGIGISYNLNQKISLGLMFNSQSDFDRISIDTSKNIFADPQKISGIKTVGLLFSIKL